MVHQKETHHTSGSSCIVKNMKSGDKICFTRINAKSVPSTCGLNIILEPLTIIIK
jgi:hypothetical protein